MVIRRVHDFGSVASAPRTVEPLTPQGHTTVVLYVSNREHQVRAFTRDRRRQLADAPDHHARRYLPLTGVSADAHFAKHCLNPRERWDELLDMPIPHLSAVAKVNRLLARGKVHSFFAELRRLASDVDPGMADELIAWAVTPEYVEPILQLTASVYGTDPASVKRALVSAHRLGGDQGALRLAEARSQKLASVLQKTSKAGAMRATLAAAADTVLERALEAAPEEVLAELRGTGARLAQNLRSAQCPIDGALEAAMSSEAAESLEDALDEVRSAVLVQAPGLQHRYLERLHACAEHAGLAPSHCVYDRKDYKRNEAYIDDDGVTVSLSPEKRRPFQMRTGYRVVDGKTSAEKAIEARDAAVLDRRRDGGRYGREQFLEDVVGQKGQKGRIIDYHTEDAWLG